MTTITVYDGNDTIGGNKIYVEEHVEGLFLDFGANLSDYDKFYKWPDQPLNFTGDKIRPKGFKIEKIGGEERPIFTRGFHASGHLSQDELEWVIDKIDPDILIPVHTENLDWFMKRYSDKVKILKKGEKLVV